MNMLSSGGASVKTAADRSGRLHAAVLTYVHPDIHFPRFGRQHLDAVGSVPVSRDYISVRCERLGASVSGFGDGEYKFFGKVESVSGCLLSYPSFSELGWQNLAV